MFSSPLRRTALVLLLAATLIPSWALAAGPKAQAPASLQLLSRAWSLLASLWGEEGCNLDPDGRCKTSLVRAAPPKVHTDTGCNLDPDGRCSH